MDASQYKDYVLVLLFIKYVSDKYAGMHHAPITIPEGASFKDIFADRKRIEWDVPEPSSPAAKTYCQVATTNEREPASRTAVSPPNFSSTADLYPESERDPGYRGVPVRGLPHPASGNRTREAFRSRHRSERDATPATRLGA
jgi:hypothetical protein